MRTMGDSVTEAADPEGKLDGTSSTPGTGVVTVCRRRVTSAVTELMISWSYCGVIAEAGAWGAAVAGRGELDEGTVLVVPEARGVRARWERRAGRTVTGNGRWARWFRVAGMVKFLQNTLRNVVREC
jgi:hypothetical protein